MKYKLIIFDMDGTFIDSRKFHAQLFHEFFEKYWKPISFERCYESVGVTVKNVFEMAEIPYKEHDRYYELLDDFYNNEIGELIKLTRVPEKFRCVLHLLKNKGVKMAVVTNSLQCVVNKILEYHSLDDFFDEIIGADKDSKDKVLRCQKILRKFHTYSEEVLLVGDTESDMELAVKIGVAACFAKTDIAWYKDSNYILQKLKPIIVIKNYGQLFRMLEKGI